MDVLITFHTGLTTNKLEMKGASQDSEIAIIDGFFSKVKNPEQPEVKTFTTNVSVDYPGEDAKTVARKVSSHLKEGLTNDFTPPRPHPMARMSVPAPTLQTDPKIDDMLQDAGIMRGKKVEWTPPEPKPRKLPMIGSENRSSFPVSETAKVTNNNPEHWATGIKYGDDGHKRYKCRYHCQCGYRSNVYIPKGTDYVTCYECETDMFVEPATGKVTVDGVPERDENGNFFTAK